jgi:hypothetical protein
MVPRAGLVLLAQKSFGLTPAGCPISARQSSLRRTGGGSSGQRCGTSSLRAVVGLPAEVLTKDGAPGRIGSAGAEVLRTHSCGVPHLRSSELASSNRGFSSGQRCGTSSLRAVVGLPAEVLTKDGAPGRIRTGMTFRSGDFKSPVSTIPPPGQSSRDVL